MGHLWGVKRHNGGTMVALLGANIAAVSLHVKVPGELLYPVLITPVPDHYPLILHPVRYLIVIPIILWRGGLTSLVIIFHTAKY